MSSSDKNLVDRTVRECSIAMRIPERYLRGAVEIDADIDTMSKVCRQLQLNSTRPCLRWTLRLRWAIYDWSWSGWRLDLRMLIRDELAKLTHRH